jgi:CDP-glycerol:poly(glycerophosphate) glycerophosphotransferase
MLSSVRRAAQLGLYRLLLAQRARYRAFAARLSPDLIVATGEGRRSAARYAEIALPAAVLAYFADASPRAYQLQQWIPVLEKLHARRPVLLLCRNITSFELLEGTTRLPLVFARRLRDLEDVLQSTDPKVCLYVNNSTQNFQPLSWRRALHVHLNHGESDKISMASNQVKVYDAVLVAGEAAELRYRENLLAFDGETLLRVGRPQLDLDFAPTLRPAARPTVMYAPTWEGDTPAMDYTSLPRYGAKLVQNLLDDGGFRVVYKPHPRIPSGSPAVIAAHGRIVRALTAANEQLADSDRHVVEVEGDILSLFPACDALLCDVSSVALDWLYLRTDAPLWICDPHDDRERLVRASPVAGQTGVLDSGSIGGIAATLRAGLADGTGRGLREEARRFYFGELAPGDSTRRFLAAIDELAERRDSLLDGKQASAGLEVGAGIL